MVAPGGRELFLLGLVTRWVCLFGAALLSFAWADHGAPAPRLEGVTLCANPSSVQLRLEAAPLPPEANQRVRKVVFENLRGTLESCGVLFKTDCTGAQGYVLLNVYARFLDPETYLGFPAASYTYVTSAQVGAFVAAPGPETALPGGRYHRSASGIVQAPTAADLEARLVSLGDAQAEELARTYLEANPVALSRYLLFTGLGLALAGLRSLPHALGQRPRS